MKTFLLSVLGAVVGLVLLFGLLAFIDSVPAPFDLLLAFHVNVTFLAAIILMETLRYKKKRAK